MLIVCPFLQGLIKCNNNSRVNIIFVFMTENPFHLGDIVALMSHPYYRSLTNIKVSGEPLLLSPLMVVTEVFLGKLRKEGPSDPQCKCLWFSAKSQSFEHAWIKFADLKLIEQCQSMIYPPTSEMGTLLTLRSMDIELGKLKSSIRFNDINLSNPAADNIMTALLSFLCPVMQLKRVVKHKSKLPIHDKATGEIIREVPAWEVNCFWYNAPGDKLSEATLPIEALRLVTIIEESQLVEIDDAIQLGNVMETVIDKQVTVIKPKHIAYRSGYYFLRAYDYWTNENIEININEEFDYTFFSGHFTRKGPIWDARTKLPRGRNAMKKEIVRHIRLAKRDRHLVRIKYKNRHNELSVRTLRDFELLKMAKGELPKYLVGFCSLRKEERTFKISRIQQVEELIV